MEAEPARRCQPLLGTLVEISVPADGAPAIDAAFAAIRHVHQRMSFHEQGSDLWRLRAQPAGTSVAVDPRTVDVLRLALELHTASGGLFDVTIGRALVGSGFLPRAGIAHLRDFPGGMADLEIVDDEHVRCHRPMLLDLGGIAKGYAVDRAVDVLMAHGVSEGLVNAGGDLRMFGSRPWPIALRQADGRIGPTVILADCALASSANLLDRRRWRGRDWTPHLDGSHRPVVAPGSIHVVADHCSMADAMTKVAMSDPDLADRLLAAHHGYLLAPTNIGNAA